MQHINTVIKPVRSINGRIRTIFDLEQMEVLEMEDVSMMFSLSQPDLPLESCYEDTVVEEQKY